MFENLKELPADPILGLSAAFQLDSHSQKVDLGVGVYKNEQGQTPVLEAVKRAQLAHVNAEVTKAYQAPLGSPSYNAALQELILGKNASVIRDQRVSALQSPGGCGALRVAAELVNRVNKSSDHKATIWVTDPTWANHIPLLGEAGVTIKTYPFYDPASKTLKRAEMFSALAEIPKGDLVLLHGCCHNPCGVDLTLEDWAQVAELAQQRGFVPFVDMAYQGFGSNLEDDAQGLRLLAERLPELVIAYSCSKNFGLYRERTGILLVISENAAVAKTCSTQLANIARGIYSMPPAHGASLVDRILADAELKSLWESEVAAMCDRINGLRSEFAGKLTSATGGRDFSFIQQQRGMFSFLGLSESQVNQLREEHSVYMVGSSRVSIAGLNQNNIDYVVQAVAAVIGDS